MYQDCADIFSSAASGTVWNSMEIEEVAAHNAEVYNPGRASAQKRKRERAQDQLLNRMRKRNNGNSTSVVSTRLRSTQRDKIESTLAPGVKPVWDSSKHNRSGDEWRDQEARYSTLAHPDRGEGDKRHRHGEVPLTELVGRVMQRRGLSTTHSSPMTIRALKPPVPPYGIQHPALIRKIQPINKRKPTSGGPYVVVLNRSSSTNKSDPTETHEPRDLPPLRQHNSSDVEIATWRPELTTTHEPYVHPNAEDRSVTNYRLQMQQAVKIAELRCDFSTSSKPMHKHAPLPAIQVAYEVADKPQVLVNATVHGKTETTEKLEDVDRRLYSAIIKNVPHESREEINRFTSSQEVLQQMQARKHAKRRKIRGAAFNNPLRTRNRLTTKMKVFKEDLQKARELSIIQEDQSSISERLSRLSAGRTSVASFRSVGSLKRIEESEDPQFGRTNQQSGKRRVLSVPETEHRESNTDSPSAADDAGLSTAPGSRPTCDTSDPDPCITVSNSDKMLSSSCSDASSTNTCIEDSNVENDNDNFASNSEDGTVNRQIDVQELVATVSDQINYLSSKPDTDDMSGSDDSSGYSPVHDDVCTDSDDSTSYTNDPLTDPHGIVSSSEPHTNESNMSGDSERATNYQEESQVVMETRLAITNP